MNLIGENGPRVLYWGLINLMSVCELEYTILWGYIGVDDEVKGLHGIGKGTCIGFSILWVVHGRSLFGRICIIYYIVVGPLSFKPSTHWIFIPMAFISDEFTPRPLSSLAMSPFLEISRILSRFWSNERVCHSLCWWRVNDRQTVIWYTAPDGLARMFTCTEPFKRRTCKSQLIYGTLCESSF